MSTTSPFASLLSGAKADDTELTDGTRAELASAVATASEAYADLGRWLEAELLDRAPEADACGRERYALWSRLFLGAEVDLEETYRWGQDEVARREGEAFDVKAFHRRALDVGGVGLDTLREAVLGTLG